MLRAVLSRLILFRRSRNSLSLGFASNLRHPLLLTGHNNFHRDEHYQFTLWGICRIERGRPKSFCASSHLLQLRKLVGFPQKVSVCSTSPVRASQAKLFRHVLGWAKTSTWRSNFGTYRVRWSVGSFERSTGQSKGKKVAAAVESRDVKVALMKSIWLSGKVSKSQ